VLDLVDDGTDLVVSMSNREPVALLDAIEAAARAGDLSDLRVHQMHPLRGRESMAGGYRERLRHVSYFLSGPARRHVGAGVEYVPANFSEVPEILTRRAGKPLVLASVAERDGRLRWGTNAEYVAALVRDGVRCVVEVNAAMPAADGAPALPTANVLARLDVDRPLVATRRAAPRPADERIAELVAERVPDGATLQIGIGAIPDIVLAKLADRDGLRVHTELLTDGIVRLAESGAVAASGEDPMSRRSRSAARRSTTSSTATRPCGSSRWTR
jgi:acyl-CoA hydrolase